MDFCDEIENIEVPDRTSIVFTSSKISLESSGNSFKRHKAMEGEKTHSFALSFKLVLVKSDLACSSVTENEAFCSSYSVF